jgi:hypothetical protein
MAKKSVKPRAKKPKSDAKVTDDAINITLTKEQKKKAREHIRKSGVPKFKIEGVPVKALPSARGKIERWITPD